MQTAVRCDRIMGEIPYLAPVMVMNYETLRGRIERRLAEASACSHSMCSSTDAASEYAIVLEFRQLLCEHEEWRVFDGKSGWKDVTRDDKDPCGCYCKACGICSSYVKD